MSRSKGLVPTEKPYHKEYSCEISKLQHLLFKSNTQDLSFPTPRSRSQDKTIGTIVGAPC